MHFLIKKMALVYKVAYPYDTAYSDKSVIAGVTFVVPLKF